MHQRKFPVRWGFIASWGDYCDNWVRTFFWLECVLPSEVERPSVSRSVPISERAVDSLQVDNMVKTFQAYLSPQCHRKYSCIHCRAHLANHDELISKVKTLNENWSIKQEFRDHFSRLMTTAMLIFIHFISVVPR